MLIKKLKKMKSRTSITRNLLIILFIAILIAGTSCKKEQQDDPITSVTDRNGNSYKVIVLDEKYWMAENLKSTKTSSGSSITIATSPVQWSTTTACCSWYAYNSTYTYYQDCGLLYNSEAMKKNPCPEGWRIPSSSEWNSMINSLGGTAVAGGKLKSTDNNAYWVNNVGATNSSKFNAYGSGFSNNGNCLGYRSSAHYWTSDMSTREVAANTTGVTIAAGSTSNGYSIRCIKDIE